MAAPREVDTVVIGGGTSGAVVAGLLAEQSGDRVLVLEAGPDHGAYAAGHWPADLLDARALGYSHDWSYTSGDTYPTRVVNFERARVMGGCSSHNGCAAIWGSRVDYDDWAASGLTGWSASDLLPLFIRANARMRVKTYAPAEVTPFQAACLEAMVAAGIPLTLDLNDLDEDEGVSPSPVNVWQGVRWNSAFAYLDPVRDRGNLTVLGNSLVDHLLIEHGVARGVRYVGPEGPAEIYADRIVVSGGTYGSPAVLLRSGIGDAGSLATLDIPLQAHLPGVGRNLHDHPAVALSFDGSPKLIAEMEAFSASHWMPEEQSIAKFRSALYPTEQSGFDLHIYPVGGPPSTTGAEWHWQFPVACMTPRSRGELTLRSKDPNAAPRLEHRYLSDADGHDRAVILDGVRKARQIAAYPALRELIGEERAPGRDITSDADLSAWIDGSVGHYYHPVGTCAMGAADDPMAVTDANGKVHGLANVWVADCSIMPVIPRANTNIPAIVVGERIAAALLA